MKLTPKHWSWNAGPPEAGWLHDSVDGVPIVWLARTDDDLPHRQDLVSRLPAEERERLERFRVHDDQQRFLVGRVLLRILLGSRLDVPPERVDLNYGPLGKPFIAVRAGEKAPHFNVSHSGNLVLLAFHPLREVGVDVEQIRPCHDWEAIARRIFSAADCQALAALNADELPPAFFRFWARHEARMKTRGSGFFEETETTQNPHLQCYDIELPIGYAGAAGCLLD